KASGGGGGRGLRVIREMREAANVIESARREALSAFGSKNLFVEKYLDCAKHIEVQVFGDSTGKIHALFDRECTVQRRHQKIIEEAQSSQIDESIRQKILKTAVELAEAAKYKNAGTVEFLYQ